MVNFMEAGMWSYRVERFVTAALVVAVVLAFVVPFVFGLVSPILGR